MSDTPGRPAPCELCGGDEYGQHKAGCRNEPTPRDYPDRPAPPEPLDLERVRKSLDDRASLNPGHEAARESAYRFYDTVSRLLLAEAERAKVLPDYISSVLKLFTLEDAGNEHEADLLREEMIEPWYKLTKIEREQMDVLVEYIKTIKADRERLRGIVAAVEAKAAEFDEQARKARDLAATKLDPKHWPETNRRLTREAADLEAHAADLRRILEGKS